MNEDGAFQNRKDGRIDKINLFLALVDNLNLAVQKLYVIIFDLNSVLKLHVG